MEDFRQENAIIFFMFQTASLASVCREWTVGGKSGSRKTNEVFLQSLGRNEVGWIKVMVVEFQISLGSRDNLGITTQE